MLAVRALVNLPHGCRLRGLPVGYNLCAHDIYTYCTYFACTQSVSTCKKLCSALESIRKEQENSHTAGTTGKPVTEHAFMVYMKDAAAKIHANEAVSGSVDILKNTSADQLSETQARVAGTRWCCPILPLRILNNPLVIVLQLQNIADHFLAESARTSTGHQPLKQFTFRCALSAAARAIHYARGNASHG